MRALSIRQPYAELILRGRKAVEYRSRPTRIVGERFYLYASGKWSVARGPWRGETKAAWSLDLAMPGDGPPPWAIELAEGLRLFPAGTLPTGVIVGTARIERVEEVSGQWAVGGGQLKTEDAASAASSLPTVHRPPPTLFAWHLADVERLKTPRRPTGHPQPVWFRPF